MEASRGLGPVSKKKVRKGKKDGDIDEWALFKRKGGTQGRIAHLQRALPREEKTLPERNNRSGAQISYPSSRRGRGYERAVDHRRGS